MLLEATALQYDISKDSELIKWNCDCGIWIWDKTVSIQLIQNNIMPNGQIVYYNLHYNVTYNIFSFIICDEKPLKKNQPDTFGKFNVNKCTHKKEEKRKEKG